MRRAGKATSLLALATGVAVLASGYAAAGTVETACSAAHKTPFLELVYRLEAGEEQVTQSTRDEAVRIVCERLRTIRKAGGEVRALTAQRIRVVLPRVGDVETSKRVARQIGAAGQLFFYDWEGNLIGPERRIGGHPGLVPPAAALKKAEREWKVAGRDTSPPPNQRLILAGAFPTVYGAVKLASEQAPRKSCAVCSVSVPRFYMFDRSEAHELIAGPVTDRADLHAGNRNRRHDGIVLKVPVGTVIVSEQPINSFGRYIGAAEPGWYVLRDNPALSGNDITEPEQSYGELNEPTVRFGFTDSGREAFHEVTRTIARRGRSQVIRLPGKQDPTSHSGHFAVVFNDEVKVRPIVNFAENPDGINGRSGAQISGGFANIMEAQDFLTILKIGALPIKMTLIRQILHRRR